jgi:hypothetical protein
MKKKKIKELEKQLQSVMFQSADSYKGVQCNYGWYQLLIDLCTELKKANFTGYILQIKSKFGGLRFYISSPTREQYHLIHKAEESSFTICEICGRQGKLRKIYGWLHTFCFWHYVSKKILEWRRNYGF